MYINVDALYIIINITYTKISSGWQNTTSK